MKSLKESEALAFQQAWLPEPEVGFQPGKVTVGWEPKGFRMHAVFQDRDIFNPEKGFNERFFLTGDVFEWFVQPPETDAYWEFHIGPDAQLYQVGFPSRQAFEAVRSQGVPAEWMVEGPIIEATSEIQGDVWEITAFLPFSTLERAELQENEVWKMSFCRYDYNRKPENVILSSTSPLSTLDFHRNFEWDDFILC